MTVGGYPGVKWTWRLKWFHLYTHWWYNLKPKRSLLPYPNQMGKIMKREFGVWSISPFISIFNPKACGLWPIDPIISIHWGFKPLNHELTLYWSHYTIGSFKLFVQALKPRATHIIKIHGKTTKNPLRTLCLDFKTNSLGSIYPSGLLYAPTLFVALIARPPISKFSHHRLISIDILTFHHIGAIALSLDCSDMRWAIIYRPLIWTLDLIVHDPSHYHNHPSQWLGFDNTQKSSVDAIKS